MTPAEAVEFNGGDRAGLAEERPYFRGAVWQNWMRKHGDDAEEFGSGSKNSCFALGVGFGVAERPRFFFRQIFVGGSDNSPERFESAGEIELFEVIEDFADGGLRLAREGFVLRFELPCFGNFAGERFFNHGGGTAGQSVQARGQVTVCTGVQG